MVTVLLSPAAAGAGTINQDIAELVRAAGSHRGAAPEPTRPRDRFPWETGAD
jgi:hypothetical protein